MASIKRIGKDKFGVPIWEAVYRRATGDGVKQTRRRFHMATRAEVERVILLEMPKKTSKSDLCWSEGVRIYLDAKEAEDRNPEAMGHVRRAADVFIDIMGDLRIEETTPEQFKDFMQAVVVRPVKSPKTGREIRKSGPKVANHHRKELLTVARYLRGHTGKIAEIPFEHVPKLSVKVTKRSPIPKDKVGAYLDALPPWVRRPVLLVLYYGLRSTAICNLAMASLEGDFLNAVDKGDVDRRIPMDALLREIVAEALEFRKTFARPDDRLFVNKAGTAWNRMSLLRAAQRAWESAGLEIRKIHEFRHTLGTLASRSFDRRMVQAAMGHRDEKSAAVYFHPDEDMAAEVRQKIITELSQNLRKEGENGVEPLKVSYRKDGIYECPCCKHKLLITKEKGRKP